MLIVDDDRAIRYELKKSPLWTAYGFTITDEATNGQEALHKIAENHFDLILIDIKMPKIDGIAFLKELRSTGLDLCVVIASGYSAFEYVRQGIVFGAFDYLLKPIENSKLAEVLARTGQHLTKQTKSRDTQLKISRQLKESVQLPIPKQAELQLFKLITQEPDKACSYAHKLASQISDFYSQDAFKTGIILDCLLANIRQQILQQKPWLQNLQTAKLEQPDKLQDIDNHTVLLETFEDFIAELIMFVKQLHLDHPDSVIQRLCEYVIQNVDNKINVETAALEFGFSSSYLGKLFRQKTGEGFVDYITTVKMEKAKLLIRSGKYKNYEISDLLGYKSPDYFCSLFKAHTNVTPTDYKRSLSEGS